MKFAKFLRTPGSLVPSISLRALWTSVKRTMKLFLSVTSYFFPELMSCFCGMVDRQKEWSLIYSRAHCQRFPPSQTSVTPRVDLTLRKSARIRNYSSPYFPAFGLNTERYPVSLRIESKCGKIRIRITPNTDTIYEEWACTEPELRFSFS